MSGVGSFLFDDDLAPGVLVGFDRGAGGRRQRAAAGFGSIGAPGFELPAADCKSALRGLGFVRKLLLNAVVTCAATGENGRGLPQSMTLARVIDIFWVGRHSIYFLAAVDWRFGFSMRSERGGEKLFTCGPDFIFTIAGMLLNNLI